jgi:hypothetical protein
MTTSTTPDADYAFWTIPGTSFTVTYSLGAFHEIEFVVNEGYRRIPHGGVETGGVLFGRADEKGVRVESFRPIECEHASGPSFNLSAKDVAGLEAQISSAASDPELNGAQAVGWFIAHTRSPLKMSEREVQLFEQLFPGPGKITVLVKPERFHPTRFGFMFRDGDGNVGTDATSSAVILPSRTAQGREGPVPSIVAPADTPTPRTSGQPAPAPPKREIRPKVETGPSASYPVDNQPERVVLPQTSDSASRSIAPRAPQPAALEHVPGGSTPAPIGGMDSSRAERPPVQYEQVWTVPDVQLPRRTRSRALEDERKGYGAQFALVLLLAALLGCCVGYWAYLQLPPPIIPLAVRTQQETLLISWPPAQTSSSSYAAIRVDDGEPVALSTAEKLAGQTSIVNGSGDVKIEVIAQHWLRDSRGIVRFIKAQQPASSGAPAATPNRNSSPPSAGSQLP